MNHVIISIINLESLKLSRDNKETISVLFLSHVYLYSVWWYPTAYLPTKSMEIHVNR